MVGRFAVIRAYSKGLVIRDIEEDTYASPEEWSMYKAEVVYLLWLGASEFQTTSGDMG